jgi:hypothetical protein
VKPALALAAIAAASLLVAAPQAAPRNHSAVTDWIELDLAQIAAHRTNPPAPLEGWPF